ncbi:MAG: T9SS type A sorting domain-containing protein [Bacteroidales bacterium]|nr:T9SS type A sorting domain-containing protein [Bacteroidales bacterium]
MKKRFLLLTLIMCLFGGVNSLSLKAQEVIITGEPESTSRSIPIDVYNKHSISQTIYYSSEINKPNGGTISSISFKVSRRTDRFNNTQIGDYIYTRTIDVYMMNIDDDVLSNALTILSANELVYSGSLTISDDDHGAWVTIDLTTEFEYEKGKNILVCVNDITGVYEDYQVHFYTFESNVTRVLQMAGKSTAYDPALENTNGISAPGQVPQIKLTFVGGGEPETPEAPTAPYLVSPTNGTTISGTTVNLSWSYGENNTATHYQVSLGTDSEDLSVKTDGWVERTGLGTDGFAIDDELTVDDLIYGTTYYWRVDVRNGEGDPVGSTVWSFATPASEPFEFITEGDWNEGTNWEGGAVPGNGAIVTLNAAATITAGDNINVADLTILDGASLTINGSLTITGNKFSNTDASKLVINDGGQIFQTNEGVKATFNMNINNPTVWSENNIDGWQFISSPFTDASASISDFVTTGVGNDYDLYKFDGKQVGAEWQNQEAIATFEEEFVSGRGYLASYEDAETATLRGTLNSGDTYSWDNLTYNNNSEDLANFHLIGNPFPFDMEWNKLAENIYNVINGYAVVLENGNYAYRTDGTIPVGDGFFVKANGLAPSMYYDHKASVSVARRGSESNNSLNIIATGNAGNDNVVVNFNGEGEGFPKLQNFNDAIATVYVQNNDVNYAIFNCNEDVQEIELCFNANQMGNYTISVEPTGEFSSIVLVDRFTGIETNLLVEDYRFTAMSEENNNRFFIRLGNGQQTTDSSHFAYVSGEDLIIEAEGTVQIIDMMGRVVYTSNVENNNRINVSDFNNGAYVVRVINENEVKVQKIIL